MSEAQTVTIADFLLARIAEDEAEARAALDPKRPGTHWQWMDNETDGPFDFEGDSFRASLRTVEEFPTDSVGPLPAFPLGYVEAEETYALPHIARHDPARVLAECEAKRQIVEVWRQWRDEAQAWHARYRATGQADMLEMAQRYDDLASHAERPMLRLAAVFADHSDYGPEWRP